MTRSAEELRRESERSRVELAGTVDDLRERITNTAEDIRHKVSPQHVKSEISDFISHKTQNWAASLKQQAMQNPMQAMAAGAIVGVPLLRLARGFPLPAADDWSRACPKFKNLSSPSRRRGCAGNRPGQGDDRRRH